MWSPTHDPHGAQVAALGAPFEFGAAGAFSAVALDGGGPLDAVPEILDLLAPEHRDRWAVMLDPSWTPADATEFNGAVWPALGSAAWALRTTGGFAEAVRAAIDLGGDTDTVAVVTGGLYGIDAFPDRWRARLFVTLPGHDSHRRTTDDLRHIAALLDRA